MRTLSLWQPWASLVALGYKQVETRHWLTQWVGPLAIHAAKYQGAEVRQAFEQFSPLLSRHGYHELKALPFGYVVATTHLDRVIKTEEARQFLSDLEQRLGNYSDGRFAWFLSDIKRLPEPVPCKGHQGLFFWEPPK